MRLQRAFGLHRLHDEAGDGKDLGGGAGGDAGNGDDKGSTSGGDNAGDTKGDAGNGDDKGATGDGKGDKKPTTTDAEAKLLKEVMKSKDKLREANEALQAANAKLKAFDGIEPEKIRKLLADQKTAEEAALAAKGDWENLKKRMAEEHTTIVTQKDAAIAEKDQVIAKLNATIGEMSVGSKFSNSAFITGELTLTPTKARMIYGDHFDVQPDGTVIGYDKPRGAADRTPIVDATGSPIGFDDVLRKLVDADPERDFLLKSKAKPGAGSGTQKPAGTPSQQRGLTSVERIAAALKAKKL